MIKSYCLSKAIYNIEFIFFKKRVTFVFVLINLYKVNKMQQKLTPARLIRTTVLLIVFIISLYFVINKKNEDSLTQDSKTEASTEASDKRFGGFNVVNYESESDNMVFVELFTSDGCFDCPPTEADFNNFLLDDKYKNVVAMTSHVDYWDHLDYGEDDCVGIWKDEYSSGENTARQFGYTRQFGVIPMTPQTVFNGVKEVTDTRKDDFIRVTDSLLNISPSFILNLELNSNNSDFQNGVLSVDFKLTKNQSEALKKSNYKAGQLQLFLLEKEIISKPTKGENCDKTLVHRNVLRAYASTTVRGINEGQLNVTIPKGLSLDNCIVVGAVQNLMDLQILGSSKGFGFEK